MIAQEFAGWTDDELWEYWQERVAVRFEDGQLETIDQARHMEAKALMRQLGGVLPKCIRPHASKFSGWSFDTKRRNQA